MNAAKWDTIVEALARRAQSANRTELSPSIPAFVRPLLSRSAVPDLARALGFALPPLLIDLYARVGNGGYGPGYGLMPLILTHDTAFGGNALAVHRFLRESREGDAADPLDPALAWPAGLLPIVHMGCSVYYLLDCRTEDALVLSYDCDGGDADAEKPVLDVVLPTGFGFADWLDHWLRAGL